MRLNYAPSANWFVPRFSPITSGLLLSFALVLAGCATRPVEVPAAPAPVATTPTVPVETPERSADDATSLVPPIVLLDPFSPEASAELQPLPMPAPDLWDRIVAGYGMPDIDGPLVEKWEKWYASRPDYMARMVERSRLYLYHIVNEVTARQMPTEIALLPMVESAFNPIALSTSRAAGIWQFIPSTGKHYGLEQNFWIDSRRDVVAATDKALDYLAKLHRDFGSWQLALAGYNWGEGNVGRAIARNKANALPTAYLDLPMPDETRNYLPKLQAVKNIVRDPEKYGLVLADIPDAPFFAVVKTTRKIDTKRAAELAEISYENFIALNPQHNRPVIAGANEQSILLPIDKAEIFAAKLELTNQPLVSWQAYRLKAGDTLPLVATRYGTSAETLRAVNGIGARARVPVGHMLLVPAERPTQQTAASLSQAVFTTVPSGRTFYYTSKRGDTLANVAARYGVTTEELKAWNGLTRKDLQAGQKLRVTSDIVTSARAGGRSKKTVATRGARKGKSTANGSHAASGSHKAPASRAAKPLPTARAPGSAGG